MTTKILLADDSLTIQKVIKITLANEPFEIVDCPNEKDLSSLLKKHQPQIVLLDFNLSEAKTGYDLCEEIKNFNSSTEVVMMFGTFDNIDEDSLKKCKCTHRIVKPFDSNKFIALCRSLISNDFQAPEGIFDEKKSIPPTSSPSFTKEEIPESFESHAQNHLSIVKADQEYSSWEVQVPGVIGNSTHLESAFPPIIEEPIDAKKETTQIFPEANDLDYPEIQIGKQEDEFEVDYHPKSKLVGLDELKIEIKRESKEEQILSDKGTDVFDLNEFDFNQDDSIDIKKLEEQIRDEVEEDLWKVDEVDLEAIKEKSSPVFEAEQKQDSLKDYDNIVFEEHNVVTKQDGLNDEMKIFIQEQIKIYVKEYLKEKAEKVSWEIIPNVAEKIIKEELQKISSQISKS